MTVCDHCNQCKCEIGRGRTCPQFDVKKNPNAFEMWKREREEAAAKYAAEVWMGQRREHEFDCPIEECTIPRRERDILCVRHYKMLPHDYKKMLFEPDPVKLKANLAVVFGYIDDVDKPPR